MVDCGNPRCAQERRFFKKELLSWSKKVPLMIALEQIAAEYTDKDHAAEMLNPYTELEGGSQQDWTAEDTCFYCNSKVTGCILDLVGELLQDARQGKLDAESSYLRTLQDILPFSIKYYTQGLGRELLTELSNKSSSVAHSAAQSSAPPAPPVPVEQDEQDVSTAAAAQKSHVELKIPYILQSGRGKKSDMSQTAGVKRGHAEEVETPVSDIHGSKQGAQQVSMFYGIPPTALCGRLFRSTDPERESAFCNPDDSNSGDEQPSAAVEGKMKLTDLIQAGTFSYLPPFPLVPATLKEQADYSAYDDFSVRLEQIRRMHNLKGDRDMQIKPAHIHQLNLPVLTTLIKKLVEQRFDMELRSQRGPEYHGLERRAADQAESEASRSNSSTPALSEDRKSQAISVDTLPHFLPYLPTFSPSCLPLSLATSVEDLRIPSYKPTANTQHLLSTKPDTASADTEPASRPFGKVYETSRIGDTLKDIIAKTISEKIKFQDTDSSSLYPLNSDLFGQVHSSLADAFSLELGKSAFRACRSDISQPTYPAKRVKREPGEEEDLRTAKSHLKIHSSTGSKVSGHSDVFRPRSTGHNKHGERSHSSSSGGHGGSSTKSGSDSSSKEKKTRPKRGQYRKYNSQLLIEAVRAVQRGEMSVHRAGSYFGVPHSTLEYKVKERHLLRQKKTRDGNTTSTSTSTTSSVSTATATASFSSSPVHTASSSKHPVMSSGSGSESSDSRSQFASQHQGTSTVSSDTPHPSSSSSPPATSLSALGFSLSKSATSSEFNLTKSSSSEYGFGKSTASEFPWFQPYLVSDPSHSPFDPALSLFPQGFALNTPASELLRKLQHKVQSKSASPSPFSAESSFGFPLPNGNSSLREGFLLYN